MARKTLRRYKKAKRSVKTKRSKTRRSKTRHIKRRSMKRGGGKFNVDEYFKDSNVIKHLIDKSTNEYDKNCLNNINEKECDLELNMGKLFFDDETLSTKDILSKKKELLDYESPNPDNYSEIKDIEKSSFVGWLINHYGNYSGTGLSRKIIEDEYIPQKFEKRSRITQLY
jgi:hypothetical protein